MPRILPRLFKEIEKETGQPKYFNFYKPTKKRSKSLYRPPLPTPSFHPSHYQRSILLATHSPVTDARSYARHKRLPPTVSHPSASKSNAIDSPRQMTDKEFEWWANPYLRMLASPLRTCIVTGRALPADLLVRLVGMTVSSSHVPLPSKNESTAATLVPDGVLHPKFASRKVGGGATYVLCSRKAVERLQPRSNKRIAGNVFLPPNFSEYIAHLLRLRVLQELELLTEKLEYAVRSGKNINNPAVILRRLSRDEWGSLRSSGTIPFPSAVAVLILPQPNRDQVTKERPKPSMSAHPPNDEERPEDLPPLSVFMPKPTESLAVEMGVLPQLDIPLYNTITAFPSRSQRAALYDFFTRILAVERFLKRLHCKDKKKLDSQEVNEKDQTFGKGSHAFLLCSDAENARRGDCAAVARALWRLRMYEGEGWPPANYRHLCTYL